MKHLVIVLVLSFYCVSSFSQEADSATLNCLADMSMSDILKIPVRVASTVPQTITETASSVSIVDRQTIERYNFRTVAEALESVGGVAILQTNLDHNVPTFRGILQNYYANKILILINNTPTWQALYGNGSIDRVAINDVERIEIMKGPASVLYGTNAYMGVINIILRSSKTDAVSARVEAGLPASGAAAVNYSVARGNFSAFVSGSSSMTVAGLQKTTGAADSLLVGKNYVYKNDTSFFTMSEQRNYTFNAITKYKAHSVFINTFSNVYTYPGVNISYATGSRWPFIDKGTLLGYEFDKRVSDKCNLYFNVHYDYFSRFYSQAADGSSALHFSTGRGAFIAKLNYRILPQWHVEGGADIQQGHSFGHFTSDTKADTVLTRNLANERDIVEGSLFAQTHYSFRKFWFMLGSRYTSNRTFGFNISSQSTLSYQINEHSKIRFSLSQAFRTPTMLELYFKHYTVVGNPNLKPERTNMMEVGYLFSSDKFLAQASVFHSSYIDLIQRVKRQDLPAEYRNVSHFDGAGYELEAKYVNPKIINLLACYSFVKGYGDEANSNFRFVPVHTAQLGLDRSWGSFFTSSVLRAYSSTEGLFKRIDPQFLLSFNVGYRMLTSKKVKVAHVLNFENITDSDMLLPEYIRRRPGINSLNGAASPRSVYYSLSISF